MTSYTTLQLPVVPRRHSHHEVNFTPEVVADGRERCSSTSLHDRRPNINKTPTSPIRRRDASPSGVCSAFETLAKGMLQFSLQGIPPPALVPLLVEHPPTEEDNFGPPFRVVINSSFLNAGSSGGNAKSAPTTPHGDWSPGSSGSSGNPAAQISSNTTPPKSPSNSAGKHDKIDRQNLKQLSASAPPQMTQAPQSPKSPDGTSSTGTPGTIPLTPTPDEPGSSKSRQKKFHRHFKQVAQEERVLNYYSCALVADILLQGQLYITKNYFAFYSNVFGYVTKLLIPTVSVLKISKEKTARIIPNAVGIVTEDDKHVFGSLLSRDATYRLMMQVWKAAMDPEPVLKEVEPEEYIVVKDGYESSLSGSERSIAMTPSPSEKIPTNRIVTMEIPAVVAAMKSEPMLMSDKKSADSQPSRLLVISTVLLVFLFLSAAILLYRISLIQSQFNDNPLLSGSDQVYQEILKWQAQLHTRSTNEVQEFLSSNLDQLAKVRKSLEALSLLLLHNEERSTRDRQQNLDTTLLRNGNS